MNSRTKRARCIVLFDNLILTEHKSGAGTLLREVIVVKAAAARRLFVTIGASSSSAAIRDG